MIFNLSTRIKVLLGIVSIFVVLLTIALVVIFYPNKTIHGSVVSNGKGCADIGTSILDKDGSAMDAAIATLFCEGVSMPQSMGLGGGFLMTVYDKKTRTVESLNAREKAPKAAYKDMYGTNGDIKSRGPLSIAVPAELRGYWRAYQRYGKLKWSELVTPTISLCENGIEVTKYLAGVFAQKADLLAADEVLREVFIDPATKKPYVEGQKYKMLRFSKTLKTIAEEGGDALHNGSLTKLIVQDLSKMSSIITEDDIRQYEPQWQEPIKNDLSNGHFLYSAPLPGSGLVLSYILNILNNYLDLNDFESIVNWQRVVESFKFAYGARTHMGDPSFIDPEDLKVVLNMSSQAFAEEARNKIKDTTTSQNMLDYGASVAVIRDHGTAHVSVLAPNGDAVSVTSTINLYFGSGNSSPQTGIIFNDQMDDFSAPDINTNGFNLPPSPSNFIDAGKQPISSMCPAIIVEESGKVRLVIGGAGGTKITTSVALVIMKHLWFKMSLKEAMDHKRFHHQLDPMYIEFETPYKDDKVALGLEKIGHVAQYVSADGFSAVTSIAQEDEDIVSAFDKRRPGQISYVY